MEVKKWLRRGVVGLGVAGAVAGGAAIGEKISQQDARIAGLENSQNSIRLEITNEEKERCASDEVLAFHDYVLRQLTGQGGPKYVIDCENKYQPRRFNETPTAESRPRVMPTPHMEKSD